MVIIVVAIIAALAIFVGVEVGRNMRSGTLHVTITNDAWLSGVDYDLYLDDVIKVSDRHLGAMSAEDLTFTCTWYDSDSHQVEVAVLDGNGDWHYDYATVPADGVAYASITI